ncbi:MAG: two-component sensor histidine kinase [Acetobacteraceae bacterium]|nr:two-component sensor histidine kinase [Acetobacteraceae bacterium]
MTLATLLAALRRPESARAAYGFAVAISLTAAALRWWLEAYLPPGFPFLTFFPAVILTAFLAGTGPAVLSALLCGAIAWGAFLVPEGGSPFGLSAVLAMGFYAAIVTIDIALIHVAFAALSGMRMAESRARALAESRSLLFTELQHRVSNNLQIVSTLLALERAEVSDPRAAAVLRDASARLALVARIQRQLHDPGNAEVQLTAFLGNLARDTLGASGASRVTLRVDAHGLVLPPDRAIPVALIVTELVSNALEHGFAPDSPGQLAILARPLGDGRVEVSVSDDGIGPAPDFDPARLGSLGLRLAQALARQLDGSFQLTREEGLTVGRLVFRP